MPENRPTRHGDLEIRKDTTYHQKLWRFQRIGRSALGLVTFLALLGVFGANGVLNKGTATGARMQVEYERFPHADTRTSLVISIDGLHSSEDRIQLGISEGYIRRIRIEEVTPQPLTARTGDGELVLVFDKLRVGQRLLIMVPFVPTKPGRLKARLRLGVDDEPVHFSQFVYP